ncbi:UNVERIFIED_CONTAM: Serine/threonine kinase [Siphonaria sp. JEL0065]|nr:Serine/threonine kinase [Siphonaria sp. JEL0065]
MDQEQSIIESIGSSLDNSNVVRFATSQAKLALLESAKTRYDMGNNERDSIDVNAASLKTSGRLKVKLIRASGLGNDEIDTFATIAVDGQVKFSTQASSNTWNEILDTYVSNSQEVEICVFSYPRRDLVGLVWFKLSELESELKLHFPNGLPLSVNDMDDTWLDLEPAGQIFVRVSFGNERVSTLRRQAVRKAYIKNGHIFHAIKFSAKHHCAVCEMQAEANTDFHQCAGCGYTCHASCHSNILTKCIPLEEIRNPLPGQDTNTGQLCQLHRIPHRFHPHKFIGGSSWCSHCGDRMSPGTRLVRCTDCEKCAHIDCAPMVPNFCGLKPNVVVQWLALAEEMDNKMREVAMAQAREEERERRLRDLAVRETMRKSLKRKPDGGLSDVAVGNVSVDGGNAVVVVPQVLLEGGNVDEEAVVENGERDRVSEREAAQLQKQKEFQQRLELQRQQKQKQQQQFQQMQEQQRMAIQNQVVPQQQSRPTRKSVGPNDFICVTVLGSGAFGTVMLAQDKSSQKFYAMKSLKKSHKNFDIAGIQLEKRVFQTISKSQHPFLVNLHSCFETKKHLCFVMEYACGGDLLTVLMPLIERKVAFEVSRARFYIAEVLLAVEFLHMNNIIHRDLKLENILVCGDGHVKLADYGICKENMPHGAMTQEYMGTPSYMPYEMLKKGKYNRSCDWWSLGVCLYIMVVGSFPFAGNESKEVLESIEKPNTNLYYNFPPTLLDLIQGLLKTDPKSRLGGGTLDAQEIKDHPFFYDIDWETILTKKCPVPWRPIIKSETDVSNFEAEFTQTAMDPEFERGLVEVDGDVPEFNFVAEWA